MYRKWLQIALGTVGSSALLLGALLVAITALAAPSIDDPHKTPPGQGAIFVGSQACITCHVEQLNLWDATLRPIAIEGTVSNPVMVVVDVHLGEEFQQMQSSAAYTAGELAGDQGGGARQRYIVRTEGG
ncbi:MAG: hypothetical protein HXY40_03535 [Chloroflexi bacterium]|nr:hypothetical protein [Chloroflexota bacterium]